MQDRRRYVANIIRQDAPALFSGLLRMYMEKADLSQTELEERSLALRDGWSDEGFFGKDESGDLTQSSISKVLNGDYKRPTYGQIFIWIYAVEEALKAKGEVLPKDIKDDMFHLMCYVPPDEIVNAYTRRENMVPQAKRQQRRRRKEEK